ncbi:S41 family peptidase [Polaribacter irgensii]|nr:S41 family peptidase [Polaribacter irgensii]
MNKYILISLLFISVFSVSCSKEEKVLPETFQVTSADEINAFIWKGLNSYYLWQKEVPTLADTRFKNLEEKHIYFRRYSSSEATFNSLLKKPEDRFSWIVDDYVALENSFQGINLSTGLDFGLVRYQDNSSNIFGYVRYVIPNSSAAAEKMERGMIFNTINGEILTDQNYSSLLFGDNIAVSVGLAAYNGGNPQANGTQYDLTKTEITENPIAIAKVIETDNKKIGYLLYNQFVSSYDVDLNTKFDYFKSENIDDLIIDLRYNGGGSVQSATYLGSMVAGQFPNEVYSKQRWNEKIVAQVSSDFLTNRFATKITTSDSEVAINSLELPRVYFIVSGSSASASELVISSLNPYIAVRVIGVETVGKQVGSVTLYDSDNLQRSGANLNTKHSYAMQPIVLEITDKNGINYPGGIIPEVNFSGVEIKENFGNLGVLGERTDPLLDSALKYITTGAKATRQKNSVTTQEEFFNSKLATPAGNNMYSKF